MAKKSEVEQMLKNIINRGSAVTEAYFINNRLAINVDDETFFITVTKKHEE